MSKRSLASLWARTFQRNVDAVQRATLRAGTRVAARVARAAAEHRKAPPGAGQWIAGLAVGPAGMRRYYLYRPSGVRRTQRLPLLVMLHGCGQSAKDFALSTRMNRIAERERFFVLYPEQHRLAHGQGCWNWYDTRSGKAYTEAATINAAIDQVCLLYPLDRDRIAVAGLSAGASMAALLSTQYPSRFKAVAMHSGVPPGAAQSSASALGAMRGHRAPLGLFMPTAAAWPPLLIVHGEVDPLVSARNAVAAAQVWAAASGAQARAARRIRRGNRHPMSLTDFNRAGRTMVTLCEVASLGHAWSGGAPRRPFSDARGPDASRMVWAFAQRQFDGAR